VDVVLDDLALEALLFTAFGFARVKFSSKLFSFGPKISNFQQKTEKSMMT